MLQSFKEAAYQAMPSLFRENNVSITTDAGSGVARIEF